MISARRVLHLALIAAAGALYLGMSHLAATSNHPPLITVLMSILPLSAVSIVSAWHSRTRYLSLILFAVCVLTFVLNLDYLRSHVAWLYFIQHAGAMLLLCITFGSTLVRGHSNALCSRIASFVVTEPLEADYLSYTWKVTLAWTIFFALSAMASVLLFFFGPIEAWSVFANLLTPILLGVMFAGEYLIRLRVMPNRTHFSISQTIDAYRKYSRGQSSR